MRCPICDHSGTKVKSPNLLDQNIEWARCNGCRSVFANKQASAEELLDYYRNYYNEHNFNVPQVAISSLEKTIDSFKIYRSESNAICDIGFGAGTFLDAAQKAGWGCSGTEYSASAILLGLSRGWNVHQGDFAPNDLPGPFDVLAIIETIEHVQNPRKLLQEAATRIRVGGLLYGTTPNAESLNMRLLGANWSVVSFPEHPILLSRRALRLLLKELGFVQIKVKSRGFNPFDLLTRLRKTPMHGTTPNTPTQGRVDYGYRLNETFTSNIAMRIAKKLISVFIAGTNLGDTLVFKAVKDG